MKSTGQAPGELPVRQFKRQHDWETWLDKNQATSSGVWLRLAKTGSGIRSISYKEALEVALCDGWIDGQKRSYDESWWMQKFTPRGPRSIWSKVNRKNAEDLIRRGKMKPRGLEAVELAKQDGRWAAAYDSPAGASVPHDLQLELDRNAKANSFFATLDKANRYAILWRIQTAKRAETRAKRIRQYVQMLERKEKLHP